MLLYQSCSKRVLDNNNNDNIQVDLNKYLAMTSCLICAAIDLSLRSQPIKVLWSMCVSSVS